MNSDELKPARIFWVDLIRVVSVFLVVQIHASNLVTGAWGKNPFRHDVPLSWFLPAEAWASLARMSVPLLFMVSGYLMLSSTDELRLFIKKRVWKVVVPLLAWSFISLWMTGFYENETSFFSALKSTIKAILAGNVYFTLWFLYVLIGLYMATPLFRLIARSASKKEWLYLAGLWGVATLAYSLGRIKGWQLNLVSQAYFAGYAGYFFMGYILGQAEQPRWSVRLSAVLLPVTILGMVYWAYRMADQGRIDTELLFDYLSLQTAVLTMTGFILLKRLGEGRAAGISPRARRLVLFFSKTSFGVYLVHALVVLGIIDRYFGGIMPRMIALSPLVSIPLVTAIAYLISVALVFVLQKIPIIRSMVPS